MNDTVVRLMDMLRDRMIEQDEWQQEVAAKIVAAQLRQAEALERIVGLIERAREEEG
jgi:hypothetical protein